MTAVVLAGGGRDAVCAGDPAAPNKAFVAVAGRALVTRAIDALRASGHVDEIVAVAPEEALGYAAIAAANDRRPSGSRMVDSLRAGLAGVAPDSTALVCVSDLPVLTLAAVDDFIDRATALGGDVVYGCVERRVHEASFPDVPHTWARMREGSYCGAGLVAMRPRALDPLERFLDRLGAARKNPLRLASIFGWDVFARYATRQLTIAAAERRASQLLGVTVRAAVSPLPEIAVNVDRPEDLALAERLVARSGLTPTA